MFLVTGAEHTVCVMKDGSVKTFGHSDTGALGHGDDTDHLAPKTIVSLGTNAQTCSAGEEAGITHITLTNIFSSMGCAHCLRVFQ